MCAQRIGTLPQQLTQPERLGGDTCHSGLC
jgi:hypothetical protein